MVPIFLEEASNIWDITKYPMTILENFSIYKTGLLLKEEGELQKIAQRAMTWHMSANVSNVE